MSEAMPNGRTKQLISSAARRARDRQLVENLKALQQGDSAPRYLDSVAPIECEFDWVEGLIEAAQHACDYHSGSMDELRAALAAIPRGEDE